MDTIHAIAGLRLAARLGSWMTLALLAAAGVPAAAQTVESRAARDREFAVALRLEPDLSRGAALFGTCAACHGSDGRGSDDGEIPAIAAQHAGVLLKQLADFRHDMRWNERMRHFTDRHHLDGAQDLADVAAYVAGLPRTPARVSDIGDGMSLAEGTSAYFMRCERCHGALGQGNPLRFRPRLSGQHYAYLLRQLEETAGGSRPGMDSEHVMLLQPMAPSQLRGIADYLSRLGVEPSPGK
jgi:cytochrome c553